MSYGIGAYIPIGKRPKIAAADLLLLGPLHLPPKALIKFPTPYMATRTTRMVKRFPLRVRVNCAVSNPVSVRLYIYAFEEVM